MASFTTFAASHAGAILDRGEDVERVLQAEPLENK